MASKVAASAEYFNVFDDMLSDGWTFPGRVRRPPTDPVNAMLSFGYTLAGGEVAKALSLRGFDTRIGLLHGLRYGRESLVLDMVEEFRAAMVDRFVLRRLNLGTVKMDDFETHDDGAVRLKTDARRDFLEDWEKMLDERPPTLLHEGEDDGRAVMLSERIVKPATEPGGRVTDDEEDDEGDEGGDGQSDTKPKQGSQERKAREEVPRTWRTRIERQVLRLWRALMKGEDYVPMTLTKKAVASRGRRAVAEGAAPRTGEGAAARVTRQRPPKR